MIRNYLLTAFRNLLRSKVFTSINIAGLTIGITACLFAALFLYQELTFDQFHRDADSIYRIAFENYNGEGPQATTPLPVGPAVREEFTEVKAMTRVQFLNDYLVRHNDAGFFETMTLVDRDFFNVFSFELIKGNPATALAEPNQIILTDAMAKKYFGDEDPVGQMLLVGSSGKLNSIVTGVAKSPPGNSQLQFDFLLSVSTFEKLGMPVNLWFQMPSNYTYVKLQQHVPAATLLGQFPGFAKKYVGEDLKGPYEINYNLTLQPLTDIHLRSSKGSELPTQGSMTSLYLFSSVAGIILLIAGINYVNLTTARYLKRAREMGVRKVAGAARSQLVWQLLCESMILSFAAGILALVLVDAVLPFFSRLAGSRIEFELLVAPVMMAFWLLLVLVPSLVAGLFPALFLSRVNIVRSLKDSLHFSHGGLILRKGLVVFQFFVATFLLVSTFAVFRQMEFIRQSVYQQEGKEQILVFTASAKLVQSMGALRNQLLSNPAITQVSSSSSVPGFSKDSWEVQTSPSSAPVRTENYVVDPDFLGTMRFELVAGRNFVKDGYDSTSFIINEKAVRDFGFSTADEAIGQSLTWGPGKKGMVIGVVKNFNFTSFREEIQPALLQQQPPVDWHRFISIRLNAENFPATLSDIRTAVSKFDENWIVDYRFMDDKFEAIHRKDLIQGNIFGVFAGIAIVISCMGLLGLAIFSTTQRNKEMGIRKTLGASVEGLTLLMLRDFVVLFLVAFLIAIPFSYYVVDEWLRGFVYRVGVTADLFVITGALVLGAVLLTVGYQTLKTASVNPVRVLQNE